MLEAATGRPENKAVIVEGWTRLRPGECRVALAAPIKPGVYFVFARSSKAHRGGQREWNGDIPLCVDPNGSFAVENPSSCTAMGLEQRDFQAVRIDKPRRLAMTFSETEHLQQGRPVGRRTPASSACSTMPGIDTDVRSTAIRAAKAAPPSPPSSPSASYPPTYQRTPS